MKSIFAFCILLCLLSFVELNDARKDPADYWKIIMKDQPIPEAIKDLFPRDPLHPADASIKDRVVRDFEVRPIVIIYHDPAEPQEEKPYVKDFEPKHDSEMKEKLLSLKT